MGKQELGDALKVAFLNCLKTYFRHNQAWPELVVVFRDGVADSQLSVVAEHEVPQFLSCFKDLNGNVPRFAYVVVQKRINTRLYNIPQPGKYENPAPCQYAHKLADMVGQHLKATPVGQEEKLFYL